MTGFESGFFVPDVSLAVAFLAGLFSFASPCVFPLIPSYLSYVSGFSVAELSGGKGAADDERRRKAARRAVVINSLFLY